MSYFRLIALCSFVAKLITKILANRLKNLMQKLVGEGQTSFIPSRQAEDNMIMVQELIHSMKKKTGKRGCLLVKLDLEKVYYQVN